MMESSLLVKSVEGFHQEFRVEAAHLVCPRRSQAHLYQIWEAVKPDGSLEVSHRVHARGWVNKLNGMNLLVGGLLVLMHLTDTDLRISRPNSQKD